MRTFCLLLILANALYFIWSQVLDARLDVLDRAAAVSAAPPPRIVLAREVGEEEDEDLLPGSIKDVQPPTVEPLSRPASRTESNARSVAGSLDSGAAGEGSAPGHSAAGVTPPSRDPTAGAAAIPAGLARIDPLSCTSIGPFADLAQAAQAQAALEAAGFEPRQRLEQGELWVGYWVSVQNLASSEAAQEALRTLTANDITDIYLMPSAGLGAPQVLSLGVFSDYQRAQRRANQVRALGFEPLIDDRTREGSVYWIDVDLAEPGQLIDSSIFQTDPGKITRLEMRGCPGQRRG